MDTPKVEQMNEAIAIFMGMQKEYQDWRLPHKPVVFLREGYWVPVRHLKFHVNWDWLMPVVEKIESLSDPVVNKVWISINGKSCGIWTYFDVRDVLRSNLPNDTFKVKCNSKTKIEATHNSIYQFIQWLNKQKDNE